MVDVQADLERVRVTFEGRIVADHVRSWGNALTITDPAHVETAGRLRQTFQNPIRSTGDSDLLRDLADYDAAFCVDLDGQVAS